MTTLPNSADRLAIQRRRLDDLVRSGADTSHVRSEIAELEARLESETTLKAAADAKRTHAHAVSVALTVNETAEQRLAVLLAAVSPLSLPPSEPERTDAEIRRDHRDAVSDMLRAQEGVRTSASRLDICGTSSQTLQLRAGDLERRRVVMAARRARGDLRPEDASELRLLELDLASLGPLIQAAASAFAAANDLHAQSRSRLAAADARLASVEALIAARELVRGIRGAGAFAAGAGQVLGEQLQQMDQASAAAVLGDLVAEADEAGERLLKLIDQISSMGLKANPAGALPWGPSPRLQHTIRDLAIRRGR